MKTLLLTIGSQPWGKLPKLGNSAISFG